MANKEALSNIVKALLVLLGSALILNSLALILGR